jgi:hypothetical protein
VLVAVLALVSWEAFGRELILMDQVLVAKREIQPNETLSPELFRTAAVPRDAIVEDAVSPGAEEQLDGKLSGSVIPEGGQLSERYLIGPEELENANRSFFVIPGSWIFMRSSALRRGDTVDIVSSDGKTKLGTYRVAFVKNGSDKEITEVAGGNGVFTGKDARDRTEGSDLIDHVEIVAEQKDYLRIKEFAEQSSSPSLLLIQQDSMR